MITTDELVAEIAVCAGLARTALMQVTGPGQAIDGTKGTCLYASILAKALIKKFVGIETIIRGGDGAGDGGIFVEGEGYGHYWIETMVAGSRFIVDITADQFGLAECTCNFAENIYADYIPGDQDNVDNHVRGISLDIGVI